MKNLYQSYLSLLAKYAKAQSDIAFLSRQLKVYQALYLGEINKKIDEDLKNEKI